MGHARTADPLALLRLPGSRRPLGPCIPCPALRLLPASSPAFPRACCQLMPFSERPVALLQPLPASVYVQSCICHQMLPNPQLYMFAAPLRCPAPCFACPFIAPLPDASFPGDCLPGIPRLWQRCVNVTCFQSSQCEVQVDARQVKGSRLLPHSCRALSTAHMARAQPPAGSRMVRAPRSSSSATAPTLRASWVSGARACGGKGCTCVLQ